MSWYVSISRLLLLVVFRVRLPLISLSAKSLSPAILARYHQRKEELGKSKHGNRGDVEELRGNGLFISSKKRKVDEATLATSSSSASMQKDRVSISSLFLGERLS